MTSSWEVYSLSEDRGGEHIVGFIAMTFESGVRTAKRGLLRRNKVEVEFLIWRIAFSGQDGTQPDGMEIVTTAIRDEIARRRFSFHGVEYVLHRLPEEEAARVFAREFA